MRRVMVAGLCVAACLFTGCDMRMQDAKEAVKERLIDPDSAKFDNVRVVEATGVVCGVVNAKNRMGGYIGGAPFFYKKEYGATIVAEPPTNKDFELAFRLHDMGDVDKFMTQCKEFAKWKRQCQISIETRESYCILAGATDNMMDIYRKYKEENPY